MQYILFFLLILLGVVFPKSKFLTGLILFMDWIMFAFTRGQADFEVYRIYFDRASMNPFEKNAFTSVESGYQFICAFSRDVLNINFESFWAVFSAISLLLLFVTIKRYTNRCALVLALFSMFPLLISIVQWRMWLGISVIIFGLRFLEMETTRGYILYAVCALIATSLQFSCVFFFVFLLCKIRDERLIRKIVIIWCVITPFFLIPILTRLTRFSNMAEKYLRQYTNATSLISQTGMLLLLLAIYYFARESKKNIQVSQVLLYDGERGTSNLQSRQIIYARLAPKMCLCAFFFWPFTVLTLETIRFFRCFIIITYILFAISLSYTSSIAWKRQAFRIAIPILSVLLMYVFSCQGNYWNSVFFPIMNNNVLIDYIIC